MTSLLQMKFREFVKLQRGFDLPKPRRKEGPYPIVGSTSIDGFHSECKVQPPGVTTGRSGALGQVLYVNDPFWPLNTTLWVKDFKGNFPRYVYYFLQTMRLEQYNAGTGVPTLNRNHLDNIDVSVQPLLEQRKVASILSAYDELIENNTRRIKILEEIAQAIYREWFVHFRFPDHEKARMMDSPVGKIPEEWHVCTLRDVAEVNARSIERGMEPEEIIYIDIASVSKGVIANRPKMRFENAPGRARRIVRDGDIIWSCVRPNRESYGLILKPEPNLIVSTGFAVISSIDIPFTYLYEALTTREFVAYLANRATGAAYPAVTASDFENARILRPARPVLETFHEVAKPIFELCYDLTRKNANLQSTHDLLLPKLVSGEVDVSELEIDEGNAVT